MVQQLKLSVLLNKSGFRWMLLQNQHLRETQLQYVCWKKKEMRSGYNWWLLSSTSLRHVSCLGLTWIPLILGFTSDGSLLLPRFISVSVLLFNDNPDISNSFLCVLDLHKDSIFFVLAVLGLKSGTTKYF